MRAGNRIRESELAPHEKETLFAYETFLESTMGFKQRTSRKYARFVCDWMENMAAGGEFDTLEKMTPRFFSAEFENFVRGGAQKGQENGALCHWRAFIKGGGAITEKQGGTSPKKKIATSHEEEDNKEAATKEVAATKKTVRDREGGGQETSPKNKAATKKVEAKKTQ